MNEMKPNILVLLGFTVLKLTYINFYDNLLRRVSQKLPLLAGEGWDEGNK